MTLKTQSAFTEFLTAHPGTAKAAMRACPFTDYGDSVWSHLNFACSLGRWPDLFTVPGFNDGLLRVKIVERDEPLRHLVTDKLKFKPFARERLGAGHVMPVVDVIPDKAGLRNYGFPDTCIIKPTDASGIYKVRRDGEPLDLNILRSFFHCNHYKFTREKFYKYVPTRLIVEELLEDDNHMLPLEYKVFCFFGRAKIIQWTDRNSDSGLIKRWYTPQWRPLDFTILRELAGIVPRPTYLADLIAAAETISEGFSSVRADFLIDGNKIIAGELTNVDGNASKPFAPDPAKDLKLGRLFTDPHVTVDNLIDW